MQLLRRKFPYVLIIPEDVINVSQPFEWGDGEAPSHIVFRLPTPPPAWRRSSAFTRVYYARLRVLNAYAALQNYRHRGVPVCFSVCVGSCQTVLDHLEKNWLDVPVQTVSPPVYVV